jgi:hypothetical protein
MKAADIAGSEARLSTSRCRPGESSQAAQTQKANSQKRGATKTRIPRATTERNFDLIVPRPDEPRGDNVDQVESINYDYEDESESSEVKAASASVSRSRRMLRPNISLANICQSR